MQAIIDAVVDTDSFFEIGRHWGTSIIGGVIRRRADVVSPQDEEKALCSQGR